MIYARMSVFLKLFTRAVFSILFVSVGCLNVLAKTVRIKTPDAIHQKMAFKNATYCINCKIDLHGDTLRLPSGSTLKFNGGGLLCNGIIVGARSSVKASRQVIFEDVAICGEWENELVYSDWINFPQDSLACNESFSNLMKLCAGECYTHFYLRQGKYFVKGVSKSAPILIPSNVYWHNEGEIHMLPNGFTHYSLVYLNKVSNVTIDGGAFIGDARNHYGQSGEWGHGIKCGGATEIVLKNFSSNYNWGDGIDLIEGLDDRGCAMYNCNGIVIENVKCLNNRRQGMSIEAAHNVDVVDSEFAFTGTPELTRPGAGVDIEPWTNNNFKVSKITFRNCSMHDNKGFDFQCEPNIKEQANNAALPNSIVLDNCTIGTMRVQYTNGLKIRSSIFTKKLLLRSSQNIDIRKSTIYELEEGSALTNVKIDDTAINTSPTSEIILTGTIVAGISFLALNCIKKYNK